MIKCTFIIKESNRNTNIYVENKTQEEIDTMLINKEYFSIKVVDEYYLIDRNIPREQHEEILLPYLGKRIIDTV